MHHARADGPSSLTRDKGNPIPILKPILASWAIGSLYDALTDAARRERTVILTLIAYAALWTLYGVIAKSSQDLHFDMVEQIVWSRELAAGFWKHPPMAAAVVSLWFDILPVADGTYYLLAMLMPTLALWVFWRLSADYLE